WRRVGAGVDGPFQVSVDALTVFDDGGGPALIAGGSFATAGAVPAQNVARWSGSAWSALGAGVDGRVRALAVLDDGNGAALYAAGDFTSAGGLPASRIARWDGLAWTPLGSGVDASVRALLAWDDGNGPGLIAGGLFTSAGGLPAAHVARWDGSTWQPLGGGLLGPVHALASGGAGPSAALLVGGAFAGGPETRDSYVAAWTCTDVQPPVLTVPEHVLVLETKGGAPGEVVTFEVGASDSCGIPPLVVCTPPSGSFFPRGTTWVTCAATDAAGNSAMAEFPVTVRLSAHER
ncbi:MAG TPA: HYR domain-containing protein, partial [Planctomycetota bacterium]